MKNRCTEKYKNVFIKSNSTLSLLLLLILLLASCTTQQPQTVKMMLHGNLPIDVPSTITAGTPVTILVGPKAASNGTPITLFAQGSYGIRVYQTSFHNRMARFALPGTETQASGVTTLQAEAGDAEGIAYYTVRPSAPVEPLTPLVGARFIIADANHWSMAIVIPFDTFGNPVQEGTLVQIEALHPGEYLDRKIVPINHLLTWRRIFSRTKAGRTIIAAQIGQKTHGIEGTLLEVPGWPVPFRISADPQPLPADGRLLTTLRSEIIRDKYGNVMPDGTIVMFVLEASDGTRSFIPTYTIDGVATAPYQAPRLAGKMTMYATILGVESKAYTLVFTAGPAIGNFPVKIQKDTTNKGYRLIAGPLLGKLEQYVPDGTPVHVQLKGTNGRSYGLDGVSDGGYVSIEIISSLYTADTYSIQVSAGSGSGSSRLTLP